MKLRTSLDDPEMRGAALRDPVALWAGAAAVVIVHDGASVQRLGRRIVALPWPVLAGW